MGNAHHKNQYETEVRADDIPLAALDGWPMQPQETSKRQGKQDAQQQKTAKMREQIEGSLICKQGIGEYSLKILPQLAKIL